MDRRADHKCILTVTASYNGVGSYYLVQTPSGILYMVYVDNNIDVAWMKSPDGGFSWTAPVVIFAGTVVALAVWYDRWSNIAAGLIHIAYSESGGADILYRNLNTEGADALSAQTTVFAGLSTAAGGSLSITRARGGNLVVAGSIDAGAEDGAWKSTDVGATWGAAIADPSEAATQDQYLLLPGWNADTQDVMLIFWDASADELSVKRYDNSANTWTETVIAAGMVDITAVQMLGAAVDLTNSQNVIIAWSAVDLLNADLRCWKITDAAITEMTNVVLNSVDDQGYSALSIDATTGKWCAFYMGKSDGSETYTSAMKLYSKVSADGGTTWGVETLMVPNSLAAYAPRLIYTVPRVESPYGWPPPAIVVDATAGYYYRFNVPWPMVPQATYLIGV
jgi:hypothetical protein